jgi:hypothetical protein
MYNYQNKIGNGVLHNAEHKIPSGILCGWLRLFTACSWKSIYDLK